MANTAVYAEEWAVKLQERLDHPTNWKEVCRVDYTDSRVLNNPYMSTVPAVQTGTRGAAIATQAWGMTNEAVTIDTYSELGVFIDRADLAQSTFANQMDMAVMEGQLLLEKIESAMLAAHASFTDFGDAGSGTPGLASAALTVSANNIDDIIRGIKREIRKANGASYMKQNGVFIIWRPEDFEILEAFVQANGFSTADNALKDGIDEGFRYMNVDHYYSNDDTASHIFAGVKKLLHLGICRSTWGQVNIIQNPVGLVTGTTWGNLSGVGIHSRADYKFCVWTNVKPLLFDVNVA